MGMDASDEGVINYRNCFLAKNSHENLAKTSAERKLDSPRVLFLRSFTAFLTKEEDNVQNVMNNVIITS